MSPVEENAGGIRPEWWSRAWRSVGTQPSLVTNAVVIVTAACAAPQASSSLVKADSHWASIWRPGCNFESPSLYMFLLLGVICAVAFRSFSPGRLTSRSGHPRGSWPGRRLFLAPPRERGCHGQWPDLAKMTSCGAGARGIGRAVLIKNVSCFSSFWELSELCRHWNGWIMRSRGESGSVLVTCRLWHQSDTPESGSQTIRRLTAQGTEPLRPLCLLISTGDGVDSYVTWLRRLEIIYKKCRIPWQAPCRCPID